MDTDRGRLTSRPTALTAPTPLQPALPPGRHDLGAGAVLQVPERLADPAPLLVFFHGAGGSAADTLHRVGEHVAEAGALLLAPSSQAGTWDLLAGRLGPDVRAVDEALARVFASYAVGPVAVAGFSDGGSYALSLGLANGDLAGAVLALSPGFVAAPVQVGRPRVRVVHGTDDQVLPVGRCGREVARLLHEQGYDVEYEEFAGGHVVRPGDVRAGLDWWLRGSPA